MGKLNLDEIEPGMVLAADVLDRNNRILLKAGLLINDKHLRILKQWGITDADIKDVQREEITAAAAAHLDQDALARAEQRCTILFRHANCEHPAVAELFRLSALRFVKQEQGGVA